MQTFADTYLCEVMAFRAMGCNRVRVLKKDLEEIGLSVFC